MSDSELRQATTAFGEALWHDGCAIQSGQRPPFDVRVAHDRLFAAVVRAERIESEAVALIEALHEIQAGRSFDIMALAQRYGGLRDALASGATENDVKSSNPLPSRSDFIDAMNADDGPKGLQGVW